MSHRATRGSRLARSGTCWTGPGTDYSFGTPLHLGVNLAARGACAMSAAAGRVLPALGADARRKQRNPVLPARLSARLSLVSRALCPVGSCLLRALCLWRSGVTCERSSPAGHGWPRAMGTDGRLADVRNFRRWAGPPENPPDSTGFIVVASRESPPNGEEPFFSEPVYEKLSSHEPRTRCSTAAASAGVSVGAPGDAASHCLRGAEEHAMIRGSYRATQSWQLVETNTSARAARLLAYSASLGVVQVDMLGSLRERGGRARCVTG
jgi:hypothetical protein